MTIDQWRQVKDIFEASLEREPSARAQFIAEHCGGDDAIRQAAVQMLRDFDESGDFLEEPALVELGLDGVQFDPGYEQGRRIGPYRIVSEIGQGGMGAVYLAERADDAYEKRVAIKMVWPGGIRSEINRRFNIERRVLAALEHPNIARLLDGGVTEDGWSYVVMEYVDGVPITEYCDRQKLSIAERLKLFQSVCEAVQYAHQNLIVHRDLKPSNILVTHAGEVKLLDFGIAKILDPTDDAAGQSPTLLNFLTPEYASPEHIAGQRITTASDVYSLGVLLYELLTGARPFNPTSRSPQELIRLIETHEPARPSQVSAQLDAATRKQLRGDLDNIILKALQKEPLRRYQSARQFSEDIARHLNGEPVIAREATLFYRTGKYLKRRKASFLILILAVATLLGITSREIHQRRRAEEQSRIQRRTLYAADMQKAQQDWQDGLPSRMQKTLSNWLPSFGEEDLRGFEWRYLWHLANSESLKIDLPEVMRALALSPDGKMIAAALTSGTTRLYHSEDGRELAAFKGPGEIIRGIAFSPDGKLLATSSAKGITRLWNLATRQEILSVSGHGNEIVFAVAFSPDSKIFATAGKDGVAKLWSVENGKELRVFKENAAGLRTIAFSQSGQTIFTGSDDTRILCWDVNTGRLKQVLKGLEVDVMHLAVTTDEKYLLACGSDPEVKMWELATGKIIRAFSGHSDHVWKMALSPDGKILASGSVDRSFRLWEIASGRELAKIMGHDKEVAFIAFTPDGLGLVTGDGSQLKLWDIKSLLQPNMLRMPSKCPVETLSLSADGKLLGTGETYSSGDCKRPLNLSVWEVESAKIRLTISNGKHTTSLKFIHQTPLLAYSYIFGLAGVLNAQTGQKFSEFAGHLSNASPQKSGSSDGIWSMDVSPDGRLIASGSQRNTVKLWTPDGSEVRTLYGSSERANSGGQVVRALAFSRDGQKLAAGGFATGIPIFDPVSGKLLSRLPGHPKSSVLCLKFSPDDRMLATAGEDSVIKIWDTHNGQLLKTLEGHSYHVTCLAWSPDGKRLVSGSKDKTIRFWNVALGLEAMSLKEHTDTITSLEFSNDGRLLVSGSWDGTVRFWRAPLEDEIRALPAQR